MALIVQKYGGTSVETPAKIQSVADRIAVTIAQGHQVIIVVSAMGRTTESLLDLAHEVVRQPDRRELDMLLSVGERISMALLSMALKDRSIPATSLTGSQSGILTSDNHSQARILKVTGQRIQEGLDAGQVVIVAGFQGVSLRREITTLGRGGSDTTAVAIAAKFQAARCEILSDIPGICSADPRLVQKAQLWLKLDYPEVAEMAALGAKVLHDRSIQLAYKYQVPLWIAAAHADDFDQGPGHAKGTIIVSDEENLESPQIVAVTANQKRCLAEVQLARPTVAGSVFDHFKGLELEVTLPVFQSGRLWFYIESDRQEEWRQHLDHLIRSEFVEEYTIHHDLVPISLVGRCFRHDGTVLYQMMESLAQERINVELGQSSSLSATVAVDRARVEDGLQKLHQQFILSEGNPHV